MPAVRMYTTGGWQDIALRGAQGPMGTINPYQIGQTWGITGPLVYGMFIPQIFIPKRANQNISVVGARAIITSGTSIGVSVLHNSVNLGYSTVTTTAGLISLPITPLSDGDRLGLEVYSPVGSPYNLSCTVFLEHSAT